MPTAVAPTEVLDEIWSLRRRVLRQGALEGYGVESEADRARDAVHLVARVADLAVGALSLVPAGLPELAGAPDALPAHPQSVEVIGVAVLPYRGRQVGAVLLQHAFTLTDGRYDVVWAHARLVAVGFFERLGFRAVSETYDILPGVAHRTVLRLDPTG